jgi:hypothetical protein
VGGNALLAQQLLLLLAGLTAPVLAPLTPLLLLLLLVRVAVKGLQEGQRHSYV